MFDDIPQLFLVALGLILLGVLVYRSKRLDNSVLNVVAVIAGAVGVYMMVPFLPVPPKWLNGKEGIVAVVIALVAAFLIKKVAGKSVALVALAVIVLLGLVLWTMLPGSIQGSIIEAAAVFWRSLTELVASLGSAIGDSVR